MTTKTKRSHVAGCGRLQVTRALRQLREQITELGDYSPIRPTIDLADGSYLTLTLQPAADGGFITRKRANQSLPFSSYSMRGW